MIGKLRACQLCVFCVLLGYNASHAAVLLTVDVSVPQQVTISATLGAASATVAGSDMKGLYLENFFTTGPSYLSAIGYGNTRGVGNLTSANDTSDNEPEIMSFMGDRGLNIFDYHTASTGSFTEGATAFVGSAVWTLNDSVPFVDGGARSGDIYFAAWNQYSLADATVIGQYQVLTLPASIPTPEASSLALWGSLAMSCSLLGVRRRKNYFRAERQRHSD